MSSIMTGRLRRKRRWTRIEKFHTSSTALASSQETPEPVEPEPEAPSAPEPEPVASAADLSILDLSIAKLTKELGGGSHDEHISELLEAEKADKNRKGAIAALEDRLP